VTGSDCDLKSLGVLVTRPERQADSLCDLISARGGRPIRFPTLSIFGPKDPAAVKTVLDGIDEFDIALFISPNAVLHALDLLSGTALPQGLMIGAVGQGTAQALSKRGVNVDILPSERFDSEALLALPTLTKVTDRRILICRGNGGRPLLGDTLKRRGARVEYAEVYQRQRPNTDAGSILERWKSEVQMVTVTSSEILDNLAVMLGDAGSKLLRTTPLVVVSERMQSRAQQLGCQEIILARRASDPDLITAICKWMASRS